ncbi:MAG: hypothetical protein PHU71_02125 [Candidatus Gracilibacteria bacterium]|nr:hypothetical protein [Candidatus Gracilibacteria bacterium]
MQDKRTTYLILAILVVAGLVYGFISYDKQQAVPQISSFTECLEAGYPVMESYPRQCAVPDGETFTEELPVMSEAEARVIAENSCIKSGESLSSGYYNENSQTWWFDANLNASPAGCGPACVVSADTKTAEINWRCTGAIVDPNPIACGIENCHGLDIVCGPNVPEACTMMYMAGDNCRQFASCEILDGTCQMAPSSEFENCKACVEDCESDFAEDPTELFACESSCAA